MRYFAMIVLVIMSLGIFGCGKPPVDKVNYKELKDTPKSEKKEPGPDVRKAGG